ncbi:MAG: sigma 54-interacting transcriptional regulator, partial [Caulobacterales bacterium]|nr:sigma 54-interacting transcriptional regulator [Caulobacterales bacterium]
MAARPAVLVIDDEVRSQEAIQRAIDEEFEVLRAGDAGEAETILERENVTVILCDQRMPGQSGVDFLSMVRERWPDPVRMIISGYTDAEDIITGVNEAGIYQYVTKPWEPDELLRTVRGAARLFDLQRRNQSVSVEMKLSGAALEQVVARKKAVVRGASGFDRILRADDSPMSEICEQARKVAVYDLPVLITGESGTGKELLARAIHYGSHRADGEFVAENCGALPDELLESELFGCKKGAYTGAYEDRTGLFEQAHGGSILLDEIGETSASFQVKLLRALQERRIRPIGATNTEPVNLRIISATNR